jgi:large subunit ribosomal protein L32
MPVPKKHKTHQTTHSRRSHMALKPANFVVCAHCGSATMRHVVCSHCGYYKGKEIINTLAATEKKAKKARLRREELKKGESKEEKQGSLEELSKKG